MDRRVIIIGAGGHAKVIADIVIKNRDVLCGFLDDEKQGALLDYPILGKISDTSFHKDDTEFILGIGDNYLRAKLAYELNLNWYIAKHPSAQIGVDVKIGEGSVVMANTIINTSAKIGKHCIINSGAIVEHDNVINDYVHLSPNVSLGGNVTIGSYSHLGIGSIVINNIGICEKIRVGAGGVVVKDIKDEGIYVGIPAKRIIK